MGQNSISDQGADALATNKTLHNLFLDRNDIHNEGAIALSKNSNIQFLDVSYNHIGKIGINNLKNSSIPEIDIGGNDTEMAPKQSKKSKKNVPRKTKWSMC